MNYDELGVEKEVQALYDTMDPGAFHPATKNETMALRLAALSAIIHEIQGIVDMTRNLPMRETNNKALPGQREDFSLLSKGQG